jgi:HAD superfamily hydrolase (TIGR01509 family)
MSLPRTPKAVVFDMDGLLVDSEAVFREVMMQASAVRGVDLPEAVFLRMVGLPSHASREVAMDHFGADFDYEPWLAHAWELAHERIEAGIPLKAGVAELLDWLDEAGLPRAIATSSHHGSVERHLGPAGLLRRFDAVIAAGDYARGKPHPDPFLAAAARLGVAPRDCLALEDSYNGVNAAHAAGMMTVMVPDLLPATEEMRALTVMVAPTLHDVRVMLERERITG